MDFQVRISNWGISIQMGIKNETCDMIFLQSTIKSYMHHSLWFISWLFSVELTEVPLKSNVWTYRCAGVYSRHFTFNIKCIFKNLLNLTVQSSTNRHHDILSTQFLLMFVSGIWCLAVSTAHRWNWSVFWFGSTTNGSWNIKKLTTMVIK